MESRKASRNSQHSQHVKTDGLQQQNMKLKWAQAHGNWTVDSSQVCVVFTIYKFQEGVLLKLVF